MSFIIIYSTGLAPFPRLSAPPHSSNTPIAPRRPPETALYSPPPGGGARQGGRGIPGGKDRRGERKGDGRMRSDRDERGKKNKKISVWFPDTLPLGPQQVNRTLSPKLTKAASIIPGGEGNTAGDALEYVTD